MTEDHTTEEALEHTAMLDAELELLAEARRKIYDSIDADLKANADQVEAMRAKKGSVMAGLIRRRGLEGLMTDVSFAKAAYNAHWDEGRGSKEVGDEMDDAISSVPFLGFMHHYSNLHEKPAVAITGLEVAIPRGAAEDIVEETAEVAEKLLDIQHEIAEGTTIEPRIEIVDDDLSERHIARNDDGEWLIRDHYGHDSYETLLEALRYVSENYNYGATEEYDRAIPEWREADIW